MNRTLHYIVSPFIKIARFRELLVQFTKRRIETLHKGSLLGYFWHLLQPLLTLVLYTFVFGYIFGGSFREGEMESKLEYALGIFLGLSTFHFLAEVLAQSPNILIENKNLVTKVVFPIEILPVTSVIAASFNYFISLCLAFVGMLIFAPGFGFSASYCIFLFPPLLFLAAGISWGFSALGVFVRDISSATGVISMAVMFSSGVFYPVNDIPPEFWQYLKYNPLIHLIENMRAVCLWGGDLNWQAIGFVYAFSIVVFYLGYLFFRILRKYYSDVL